MENTMKDEFVVLCEEVYSCNRCDLCNGGKPLNEHDPHVMGQGNIDADVMFIAEAPGFHETVHRRPLTPPGVSGKEYERVLGVLGFSRDDVYTTNCVLCRPPKNRDPEPWEVRKCNPYLRKQIEIVKPKIIVSFGRFAAQVLLGGIKITNDHGKLCRSEEFNVNVFPMYHPAYVVAYAPKQKREEFQNDVLNLKSMLESVGVIK